MFIECLEKCDQLDMWTMPYFNTCFADGTYDVSGNTIFSAISNGKRNIIKLMLNGQEKPNYFDMFQAKYDDLDMIVMSYSGFKESMLILKSNIVSVMKSWPRTLDA